jgi:hypothetical protein
MRIKSGLWVSAYIRRLNAMAVPALVARRGDGDAGAIYIKINTLDGQAQLLRPAVAGREGAEDERFWSAAFAAPRAESEVDSYLARQRSFDADLWIVEIEDRAGRHFIEDYVLAD